MVEARLDCKHADQLPVNTCPCLPAAEEGPENWGWAEGSPVWLWPCPRQGDLLEGGTVRFLLSTQTLG